MTASRSSRIGILAALLASGCADQPAAPLPEPGAELLAVSLVCRVEVAPVRVACASPAGASGDLILTPGDHVELEVADGGAAGDSLTLEVRLRNRLRQPLGTLDGITPAEPGTRVFFTRDPETTEGTGTVRLAHPDGFATYLAADEPYFDFPGILAPGERSAPRAVTLRFDPEVRAFSFAVAVAAPVPAPQGYVELTPDSLRLAVAGAARLAGSVRDGLGHPLADPVDGWESSDPAVATVNADGTVRGVAAGAATIIARSGTREGRAAVRVCGGLAPGEARVLADAADLCLAADSAGAGYLLVAGNAGPGSRIITATARGVAPAAPATSRAPSPGTDAEAVLRERERRELGPILATFRAPRPDRARLSAEAPSLGALMGYNVASGCSAEDRRTGRVVAIGRHVLVLADTASPDGGFGAADWASIAADFDALVHPVVTASFGDPVDLDGNGKVVAFYTPAVNQLAPAGATGYLGAFMFSRDALPRSACASSNQAEVMFMLVPDPAGTIHGNARSVWEVRRQTVALLAHELQHVVNVGHRVYRADGPAPLEEGWLNEALSHVAEEMIFYRASGLRPGMNLDRAAVLPVVEPLMAHQANNFYRLREWLQAPEASGPFAASTSFAGRGAAWSFLRYAADRRGGDPDAFWRSLVDGDAVGMANLAAATGADPAAWWRDWLVAGFADDAVHGDPAYTLPSWNARTLFIAGYPLAVRSLAESTPVARSVAPGGATYLQLTVPPGAIARIQVAGTDPAALVLLRIR